MRALNEKPPGTQNTNVQTAVGDEMPRQERASKSCRVVRSTRAAASRACFVPNIIIQLTKS